MPGGDGEGTEEAKGCSQTPAIEDGDDNSASRVTTNARNAFMQDGPLPGSGDG